MARTRDQTNVAKRLTAAKAKAKAKPTPKKLSEVRKCTKCKKTLSTHSSLMRHKKKRFSCDPKEVETRKKKAREAKRARNAEDYKWRRKGFSLAIARKVMRGEGPLPPRRQ